MKVTVLFSYTAQVIPPRCRKPRSVLMHDGVIEVEIDELDAAEAPVAMKVHKRERVDGKTVADVLSYRWARGHLWTNFRTWGCSRCSFVSGENDWLYRRPPAVMDLRAETDKRTDGYRHGLTFRDWDSKQDVEAQVTAWAQDLLILKGLPGIWSTTSEPRYVVMTFGMGRNHGGTALMLDAHYNSNISKTSYFSALDHAGAKAEATRRATLRGDTKSLPIGSAHGTIEVLIPEAVRCKPLVDAGEGDPFLNRLNAITETVSNPALAAFMVMGAAIADR